MPVSRLDGIVLHKARWVIEKVRLATDPDTVPGPRGFSEGETFLYLGRRYPLRVRNSGGRSTSVLLVPGALEVSMSGRAGTGPAAVRKALIAWYRTRAVAHAGSHVVHWARMLGVPRPRVLIRGQRARWGSCDRRGVIRINWRVIQAPTRLVDYVIAHELTHLLVPGHPPAFWATLGAVMPDAVARRKELRRMCGLMDW